jgi:hypothetical protein
MKLATAAAALTVISAASFMTSPCALAQDVPPSVRVPQAQADQPSNVRSTPSRTVSAGFTVQQGTGSATGDASKVSVAPRSAPTVKQQTSTGAANGN